MVQVMNTHMLIFPMMCTCSNPLCSTHTVVLHWLLVLLASALRPEQFSMNFRNKHSPASRPLPESQFWQEVIICNVFINSLSEMEGCGKMGNDLPITVPSLPLHPLFKTPTFSRSESSRSLSAEIWSMYNYFSTLLFFHKNLSWFIELTNYSF